MSILIIAESREKGEKIAASLGMSKKGDRCISGNINGNPAVLCWASGHLFQPIEPNKAKPDCNWFDPSSLLPIPTPGKMEPSERGAPLFKHIKNLLTNASEVWIGTDIDREGEAIGRDILKYAKWKGTTKRLWFSGALEAEDVQKAVKNILPAEKKLPGWRAQQARQGADWLWQFLVRAYTMKGRAGLMGEDLGKGKGVAGVVSVGRVQTTTLKMIVERDLTIENFVPIQHYEAQPAAFGVNWNYIIPDDILPSNGIKITDDGVYFIDKEIVKSFAERLNGCNVTVIEATKGQKKKNPPLPHSLTSLQRLMSKKYGISAANTLKIADKIRLDGYLTYPRTEHGELPASFYTEEELTKQLKACSAIPELKNFAQDMLEAHPSADRPKCYTDKPMEHHGIIPTGKIPSPSEWSKHELAVYTECAKALVTALHPPAIYSTLKAKIAAQTKGLSHESPALFGKTFNSIIALGWLVIEGKNDEENDNLPAINTGDKAIIEGVSIPSKETKPPARFTEYTLLGAMLNAGREATGEDAKILKESSGIGTPATRASILETLESRAYISKQTVKKEEQIISTTRGRDLIKYIPEILASVTITARWEAALRDIEQSSSDSEAMELRNDFIAEQIDMINDLILRVIEEMPEQTQQKSSKPTEKQAALVIKLGAQFNVDTEEALASFEGASKFLDEYLSKAKKSNPPTEKMLEFAKKLAEKHSLELPEECLTSFEECSAFINKAKEM